MAQYSGGSSKKPLSRTNAKPAENAVTPGMTSPAYKSRVLAGREGIVTPAPVQAMIFGKKNYQFMGAGIAFLILGFYLMSGTTDIMSSTKIVLAPILVLIGFGLEFYAILTKSPKSI